MQNYVITIAREYGSGGKTIGKMLARELDCEYYDKELLRKASDESGISERLFAEADEKLRRKAAKLIKLKDGVTVTASLFDVVDNPKKLKFVEIEAAQLPHSLADVDAAAVNSAYAIPAGLSPAKDALALESKDAPFAAVVIAAREDNKNDPRIARFIKAYQSDEVKAFVAQKFPGAYTTSW